MKPFQISILHIKTQTVQRLWEWKTTKLHLHRFHPPVSMIYIMLQTKAGSTLSIVGVTAEDGLQARMI